MKICLIASIFYPYARGGAEAAAENAALSFALAGDEVIVITAGPYQGWRSLFARLEFWQGIKIYRFYPLNFFSFLNISRHGVLARLIWHFLDIFNFHSYFAVRRILKKEKPILILTHNLKGLGYLIPSAIKNLKLKIKSLPWLHTLHDMGAIHPTGLLIYGQEDNFLQKFFIVCWYAKINIWLFGSPDVVISPSKFLLDFYLKRGFFKKSRTEIIRNPIIIKVGENSKEQTIKRFLYLGQLEVYKGLKTLFDAWRDFGQERDDVELLIVGKGSLENEAREMEKQFKNIRYLGFLSHEKISEVFLMARFMIIPSLAYENAPMTIAESFCYSAPVIGSKIGGIPEMIKDGENGFLFEPNNKDDLVRVLNRAVSADWPTLSQNAKASAEDFSREKYVRVILNLFQDLQLN